jgi:hypothetical protein
MKTRAQVKGHLNELKKPISNKTVIIKLLLQIWYKKKKKKKKTSLITLDLLSLLKKCIKTLKSVNLGYPSFNFFNFNPPIEFFC